MHNGNINATPPTHIKTEGTPNKISKISHSGLLRCEYISHFTGGGIKRTSPIVNHRPAKIRPHYVNHVNDSLLSPGSHSGRHSTTAELMSPEISSLLPEERAHLRPKHDDG